MLFPKFMINIVPESKPRTLKILKPKAGLTKDLYDTTCGIQLV